MPRARAGYLEAFVGALVGAAVGLFLALTIAPPRILGSEPSSISDNAIAQLTWVILAVAFVIASNAIGCFAALRIRRQAAPIATAFALFTFSALAFMVTLVVPDSALLLWTLVIGPFPARWIVLRLLATPTGSTLRADPTP